MQSKVTEIAQDPYRISTFHSRTSARFSICRSSMRCERQHDALIALGQPVTVHAGRTIQGPPPLSILMTAIVASARTFLRMTMPQDLGQRGAGKPRRLKPALVALAWALGAMTAAPVFAQKSPPPDVMERLREAQKTLDALSPEQKKQLRDMGVSLPDAASIPQATQRELANATRDPRPGGKDTGRIARIGATPLTAATLPAFLRDVQALEAPRLQPQAAALGEAVYRDLRAQGKTAVGMGAAARISLVSGATTAAGTGLFGN